jgi:hypothetical protein
MKISLKQSGGFAGIEIPLASVDTTRLAPEQASQLETQLNNTAFFNLPANVVGSEPAIGADMLQYEITVDEGNQKHTVRFRDDNSPNTAPLRKLVTSLKQIGSN